jgi:hypothetical protein
MRGFVGLAVIGGALFVAQSAGAQQQQQQGQGTPYATQPVYTAPPPPNGQPTGGEYVQPGPQPQPQPQTIYVQGNVGLAGPREITTWEDGDPVPPGYHPDTRVRKGLVIGGAVTFGVFYLISALIGAVALDCNSVTSSNACGGLGVLLIPVAGPFIALGTAKPDAGGTVALLIDGLAEAGGAAMLILGIAIPRTVLVRNDLALGKKETVATITPVIGGMQNGLKITF